MGTPGGVLAEQMLPPNPLPPTQSLSPTIRASWKRSHGLKSYSGKSWKYRKLANMTTLFSWLAGLVIAGAIALTFPLPKKKPQTKAETDPELLVIQVSPETLSRFLTSQNSANQFSNGVED